jgi:uncharacterized membrane-anchored protein
LTVLSLDLEKVISMAQQLVRWSAILMDYSLGSAMEHLLD